MVEQRMLSYLRVRALSKRHVGSAMFHSFIHSSFGCGAGDYKFSPRTAILSLQGNCIWMQIVFCIPLQLLDVRYVACPLLAWSPIAMSWDIAYLQHGSASWRCAQGNAVGAVLQCWWGAGCLSSHEFLHCLHIQDAWCLAWSCNRMWRMHLSCSPCWDITQESHP